MEPQTPVKATIATSIMPKRIEAQQAAVRSWQCLGFHVISVNVKSELATLVNQFDGVEFIPASVKPRRTALIEVKELLANLRQCPSDIYGIVNSDVILRADGDLIRFLKNKCTDNTVVYGSRIEVDSITTCCGTPYSRLGYDYFFFPHKALDANLFGDFALGAPMWDYWFPVSLALNGSRLSYLVVPVGFHLKHEQHWRNDELEAGRQKFIDAIRKTSKVDGPSSKNRILSIVHEQGLDGFVENVSSVLLQESEHAFRDQQDVPYEKMLLIMDTLRLHRQKYDQIVRSRSWRWTHPARRFLATCRCIKDKIVGFNERMQESNKRHE